MSEILLYLSQYQSINDWQAVVIFSDRAIAPQSLTKFQQELIANNRIIPIYLNQLEASQSIGINIIQLITSPKQDALQLVQNLKQQNPSPDITELIETVLVYKFTNLSRQEVETMFALSDLKKTRVYQEALEEGEHRGRQEVALNLLKTGMSISQVAQVTGLTIEKVEQLQA